MFKHIFEGCWFHSSLDNWILVFTVSSNWHSFVRPTHRIQISKVGLKRSWKGYLEEHLS